MAKSDYPTKRRSVRVKRRQRSSAEISSDAREWIMFLVAIGIIIYFAVRGSDLSGWWLMLLGSMLGLSMLVAGVQGSSWFPSREDDEEDGEDEAKKTSETDPKEGG